MKEELIINKNYPGVWVSETGHYFLMLGKTELDARNLVIDGVIVDWRGGKGDFVSLTLKNGGRINLYTCKVENLKVDKGRCNLHVYSDLEIASLLLTGECDASITSKSQVIITKEIVADKLAQGFIANKCILPKKICVDPGACVRSYEWIKNGKTLSRIEALKHELYTWLRPSSIPRDWSENRVRILR